MKSIKSIRVGIPCKVFIVIGIFIASFSFTQCAKKPKVYKVGVLCGLDFFCNIVDGFKTKMTELGYVEGKNIIYDVHQTAFNPIEVKSILNQFVAEKVDLIFTFPTEVSLLAKKAVEGTDIPVLFADSFIENTGLVNSVRNPGGNMTGVRYPGVEIAVKRFQIMIELAPKTKRIWICYQPNYPSIENQLDELRKASEKAGVQLMLEPFEEIQTNLHAFEKKVDSRQDAIIMIPGSLNNLPSPRSAIVKLAADHRIPFGSSLTLKGDSGALFGFGPDQIEVGKQSAILADKIFTGTPTGAIPVVSAENFLEIDLHIAKDLGIPVPEGYLKMADKLVR